MNLTELVTQHLPSNKKASHSGGVYICCPMCTSMGESRNDTKFRCGFTPQPDGGFLVHCHNCKFSTRWGMDGRVGKNLMKFLTKIGIDSRQVPLGLRLLRKDEKAEVTIIKEIIHEVVLEFDVTRLPPKTKKFSDWLDDEQAPPEFVNALEYLVSRGTSVFDGWIYFWTPDIKRSMNQRVIIPFYHHGKIVGYTARTFTNNSKLSKYYAETQTDYLFNQDKLEGDANVILLVEGVFDAIAIKGVASMGNLLTDKQINLLNRSQKEIIVVPDRAKTGSGLVEQAIKNNWKVSIPTWDIGDIDDVASATKKYGRLYTLKTILESATDNKDTIRMKFEAIRLSRKG